jgi:hypothetical protein
MRSTFNFTHIIKGLPLYMQFMPHARIRSVKIRWKTLGSSLSIHGLINLGWNTLREKLPRSVRLRDVNWRFMKRQQAFLAPLPGIGNTNPREIYLSFRTNPNFLYCIYPCFLVCVLENRWKKLDTDLGLRGVHNPLQQQQLKIHSRLTL